MNQGNINAVILSAGKGTRMKSTLPKVLHEVLGKPMIQHVVDNLKKAQVNRLIAVVGFGADQVINVVGNEVEYVKQIEQLGTGHAVRMAEPLLATQKGTTIVICGDTPLISYETIQALLKHHQKTNSYATILTTEFDDATGYGRIIRDETGSVVKIVEEKDASLEEKQVKEINTGTYCFDNEALFKALKQVTNDNAAGEYYLTDVIAILKEQGFIVSAYMTPDQTEVLGVNDRIALAQANQILKQRINEHHMRNGVTIVDPNSTYISIDVTIGQDSTVYPGTVLTGKTTIGEHCIIGPHTEIHSSDIANHVEVKHSTIFNSSIGSFSHIGPYAYLRDGAEIGEHVRIGNFVEIKKSTIGNNTKAAHLTYIGDAEVGKDVNMGCGSITVNYDGKNKYRTIIKDGAFIGSNANLVAPITIEKEALVAAGSTVTKDVPERNLAIARVKDEVHRELKRLHHVKQNEDGEK